MKILVGVNVLQQVSSEVYGNHCQFWYNLGKEHPDWQLLFYHPRRSSIDNMRNYAADLALQQECDYLMFLDDDIIMAPRTLESLLAAKCDIVQALTFIRVFPFKIMCFKEVAKTENGNILVDNYYDYKEHIGENGLLQTNLHSVGFSCALINCEILKKISKPYFLTAQWHTEDIYFCIKAREELGKENVKIAVDTKIPTGHLLDQEIIHPSTRESLIEYGKNCHGYIEKEPIGDRTLPQVMQALQEIDKKYKVQQ